MRSNSKEDSSIETSIEDSPSTLHYLWIGPPSLPGVGVPGHDVTGPIEMAKVNKKNPIVFWCLKKHLVHYSEKFKDLPNIQARAIEQHVANEMKHPKLEMAARQLQEIIDVCLNERERRGSARDKISVKVAMSLFILQSLGGYVLDTNIFPLKETKVKLPQYDEFYIPAFKERPTSNVDIDFWMMFSPGKDNREAEEMLSGFYLNWRASEKLRKQEGPSENYYNFMTQVMPIYEQFKKGQIRLWLAQIDMPNAIVDELGLIKSYNNTHRYHMRTKYDQTLFGSTAKNKGEDELLSAIQTLNPIILKALIKNGVIDVNQRAQKTTPHQFFGETPLHVAVRAQRPEIVRILLEAGANPDLVANFPGNVKISSRYLMQEQKSLEYVPMLKDYDAQRNMNPVEEELELPPLKEGSYKEVLNRSHVIPFIETAKINWSEALRIVETVPSQKLLKFLKLANLSIKGGVRLARYAQATKQSDLTIALIQANFIFLYEINPDYAQNLLQAIYQLKDNKSFNEAFLRKAIVLNPEQVINLIEIVQQLKQTNLLQPDVRAILNEYPEDIVNFSNQLLKLEEKKFLSQEIRQALLTDPKWAHKNFQACSILEKANFLHLLQEEDVLQALFNHDHAEELARSIVTLSNADLFKDEIRKMLLSNPPDATAFSSLCMKLNQVKKLSILPLLLNGENKSQRIKIGLMLAAGKLLDKFDDIHAYNLLEPENAKRLSDAISTTLNKRTSFKDMFAEKEDLDQLVCDSSDGMSKRVDFKSL